MNFLVDLKTTLTKVFGRPGDMRNTGLVFLSSITFGIFIVDRYTISKEAFATSLLWILSSLTVGAAIGFLFGIPKIVQNSLTDNSNGSTKKDEINQYRQQVNSNLTEISDWLTKIIVGLTLINLGKFPPYLYSIAKTFADGLNQSSPKSTLAFAYGIIISYSVIGFLFGYLTTRLFLAAAFSRADQEALNKLQKSIESTNAEIESLQSNQSFISQSLYSKGHSVHNNTVALEEIKETGEQQMDFSLKELERKATQYLRIDHPDWGERVKLKDMAGNDMCDFAFSNNIPKNSIVDLAVRTSNEALVLVLAIMINVAPDKGDFDKLIQVAQIVKRLHIRHKVAVAIGKLFKLGLVSQEDRKKAVELLDNIYRRNADEPLIRTIDSTISLINSSEIY